MVLTTAICVKSNAKLNGILAANVEALAGEPEEDKNGALYANPSGTNFCCGDSLILILENSEYVIIIGKKSILHNLIKFR